MSSPMEQVLQFWFGELDAQGVASQDAMQKWWKKDPAFDQEIRDKFFVLHEEIAAGKHETWLASPRGRLAYIIVLDQFSRNMFRDTAQMFASDAQALNAALEGIEEGADRQVPFAQRVFYYLPLEHSEKIDIQNKCISLIEKMRDELPAALRPQIQYNLDYAIQHRDIIARFGRFPHRNELLKRQSTPEEIEFLRGPGSSF